MTRARRRRRRRPGVRRSHWHGWWWPGAGASVTSRSALAQHASDGDPNHRDGQERSRDSVGGCAWARARPAAHAGARAQAWSVTRSARPLPPGCHRQPSRWQPALPPAATTSPLVGWGPGAAAGEPRCAPPHAARRATQRPQLIQTTKHHGPHDAHRTRRPGGGVSQHRILRPPAAGVTRPWAAQCRPSRLCRCGGPYARLCRCGGGSSGE